MIPHTLHIGERVWSGYDCEWGYIVLINGKEEDCLINDETSEVIVTLWDRPRIDERHHEWETFAKDCYQIAEGKYFYKKPVCFEHKMDDMIEPYPFYSPLFDENLWEFELD